MVNIHALNKNAFTDDVQFLGIMQKSLSTS